MTSDQLFAAMPPQVATDILEFVFTADKPLYKSVLETIAQSRKVRPVFLERQARSARHKLMSASLARPAMRLAADNLLRTWLLKKHFSLLGDFLDDLKIPHEDGVVQDLPASVDDAALHHAVDTILGKHPSLAVAVYLHAFNSMNDVGWANLDGLLSNDPRLSIKAPA